MSPDVQADVGFKDRLRRNHYANAHSVHFGYVMGSFSALRQRQQHLIAARSTSKSACSVVNTSCGRIFRTLACGPAALISTRRSRSMSTISRFRWWPRSLRPAVPQFHAKEKSGAADLGDQCVPRLQLPELITQIVADALRIRHQPFGLDHFEHGHSGRAETGLPPKVLK